MSKKRKNKFNKFYNVNNSEFIDSAILNQQTFFDYLERFRRIALSIFEWVNLPKSMDSRFLERSLYLYGMASLLYDENYGFINTNCASNGNLNIYGLPTSLNCYSYEFNTSRKLYTGLNTEESKKDSCILVMNNWEKTPTVRFNGTFCISFIRS